MTKVLNTFLDRNFLLKNELAEKLYHQIAAQLPVIDFHNHLKPADLSSNRKFSSIADAWLLFDPYKHRAMRICGVKEKYITGNATEKEKFLKWAETLTKLLGNPLFIWSALELKRLFGIEELLSEKNAEEIWNFCNEKLQGEDFGTVDILKKFKAEKLVTSDDLLDDTNHHRQATQNYDVEVYPSLRGDTMLNIDLPAFEDWFEKLESLTGKKIDNLENYKLALVPHLEKFQNAGCVISDHSLDEKFSFKEANEKNAAVAFKKWISDKQLSVEDVIQFKNHMLHWLGTEYAKRNWAMQLHIGAQRFTSSRLRAVAGVHGGYAAVGNSCDINGLCHFMDSLEKKNLLPKMILYNLNPVDNEALATLTGSYSEDGVAGKIQFGPAWWYNDHYDGISRQLTAVANYGVLSRFIGMTTDSRSVFSFSRHEYFRRILCNLIATWVEQGNIPNNFEMLAGLVKDVSYYNSKNWLS